MNWTEADVRRVMEGTPQAPVRSAARGRTKPQPGVMNKGESAYAQYLETQKMVGEIREYWYSPINLQLAKSLHYKPDFMVFGSDLLIYMDDVKGRTNHTLKSGEKKAVAWMEEDARPKILIAARLFPFIFRIVFPLKDGQWSVEEV